MCFQTKPDTEVIIHRYKQWDEEILNHLNGMFGLAIWNEKKKKLIVAQDAMDIKIVYYQINDDGVYFASEIREIVAVNNQKPEVDTIALNLFFHYRYTPSFLTIFKDIRKLALSTMIIFEDGKSQLKRWYTYKPEPFSPMKSIKKEIDNAITEVISKSAFIGGPFVKRFEEAFAKFCYVKYCIGVGNGTDALFIALKLLGVSGGYEVKQTLSVLSPRLRPLL